MVYVYSRPTLGHNPSDSTDPSTADRCPNGRWAVILKEGDTTLTNLWMRCDRRSCPWCRKHVIGKDWLRTFSVHATPHIYYGTIPAGEYRAVYRRIAAVGGQYLAILYADQYVIFASRDCGLGWIRLSRVEAIQRLSDIVEQNGYKRVKSSHRWKLLKDTTMGRKRAMKGQSPWKVAYCKPEVLKALVKCARAQASRGPDDSLVIWSASWTPDDAAAFLALVTEFRGVNCSTVLYLSSNSPANLPLTSRARSLLGQLRAPPLAMAA